MKGRYAFMAAGVSGSGAIPAYVIATVLSGILSGYTLIRSPED